VPQFTLAAPAAIWAKFLEPVPPRHHHAIFAMLARVPEFSVRGDQLAFLQHCHVVRRVLEVGKWLALGHTTPVPTSLHPPIGIRMPTPAVTGGYAPVTTGGVTYHVYHEHAGKGRDLLCLHTAGADGRQFHRLMADPRITASHRMVAFDLPCHGKSPPPTGSIPGAWRLNTDLYVALIMAFIEAAHLDRPIVLGASMSGEICLELAYRHPDAFTGIVACEASERIERRQTPFSAHPQINAAYFVPEWIRGLTSRCPLYMLTGEYDYSCTVEHSAATAAKISGVRFQPMQGIGHFPFAENPALFADYLLPILRELGD
jgi:pimeloyl-ACP methyl ester carboxylesterase